ncbi:hypothetical protein SELMODRAFT_404760 [Selaginella moellendorffii]|uniref:Helitron helicase-like domain-containing protein n=1 Tax=Selaginella moellendorffii TaxID=88036 RepID=D8QWA9_SELML|nr:hypothetical protein SELMODRAFT_404760 [Selaginella moellendorffii]
MEFYQHKFAIWGICHNGIRSIYFNLVLTTGKLTQQYMVDTYTKIEGGRLTWIRNHQRELHAEAYGGLLDFMKNRAEQQRRSENRSSASKYKRLPEPSLIESLPPPMKVPIACLLFEASESFKKLNLQCWIDGLAEVKPVQANQELEEISLTEEDNVQSAANLTRWLCHQDFQGGAASSVPRRSELSDIQENEVLQLNGKMLFKSIWVEILSAWQPLDSTIVIRWSVHDSTSAMGSQRSL